MRLVVTMATLLHIVGVSNFKICVLNVAKLPAIYNQHSSPWKHVMSRDCHDVMSRGICALSNYLFIFLDEFRQSSDSLHSRRGLNENNVLITGMLN